MEPSLTRFLASWPRQRQEARGGTSASKALDPSARTLHRPANTLGSSNYRLRNRRRRKKKQRNDTEKWFSFTLELAFEARPLVRKSSVYRYQMEQYYAKTERVRSNNENSLCRCSSKTIPSSTITRFLSQGALIAPSYHDLQLPQLSAHPLPKYKPSHSPTGPLESSSLRLQQPSTPYFA